MAYPHWTNARPAQYAPGDIIRFTYKHQSVDDQTGDPNKEVLVLSFGYQNKLHGVDLKRLAPRERKILEFLLDPEMKNAQSNIALVNMIRKRMNPIEEIGNPMTFYANFIKKFLNGKDAYRVYIPKLMSGVSKIKNAKIGTGKKPTDKPLFGQVPNPVVKTGAPPAPLTAIDVMKQNAAKKGLK